MKKLIYFIAICIALQLSSNDSFSQTKELNKELKKEYKKTLKRFKKEKWVIVGSRSMEVQLLRHYEQLNETDKNQELMVTVENCPTENLCDKKALVDASTKYATIASAYVRGRINSAAGFDAVKNTDAIDKFYSGYDIILSHNIAQIFNNRSFALMKNTDSGYTYRFFYIINEESAAGLRKSSVEQALKDTDLQIDWSNKIKDFVNEGFKIE